MRAYGTSKPGGSSSSRARGASNRFATSRSLALPVVDRVGRRGRCRPRRRDADLAAVRVLDRPPATRVRREDHHRARARSPGGRPRARREADDVAAPQHALAVGPAQRRRPVEHDEPLLHPVVEVVRVRALAFRQLVDARADLRRRRPPCRRSRRASGTRRARSRGRARARRRSCGARAASLVEPERRGEAARGRASRPGDLGMPALPVDQHRAASRPRARPRCRRASVSPTITASAGVTSSSSSIARKIVSCGFVFPCACEVRTASATSPWWATNSAEVRATSSRAARSAARARRMSPSVGAASSYSSKCAECAQRCSISTAARYVSPRPAHADDHALGEEHPDLLVVVELGMPLHLRERRRPRLLVPRGVEVEPVPQPERAVPVRPEVGPGLREREVDVEDDGAKHATEDRSLPRREGARAVAGARLAPGGRHAVAEVALEAEGPRGEHLAAPPVLNRGAQI